LRTQQGKKETIGMHPGTENGPSKKGPSGSTTKRTTTRIHVARKLEIDKQIKTLTTNNCQKVASTATKRKPSWKRPWHAATPAQFAPPIPAPSPAKPRRDTTPLNQERVGG